MNVVSLILQQLKRKGLTKTDVARMLQLHPSTVSTALSRSSINTQKLIRISEALQYNFFREVAEKLAIKEPTYDSMIDLEAEKAPLIERIKALELENSILRQTLRDVTSR
jgi:transcriptional regulator with XRE-family HTH domain